METENKFTVVYSFNVISGKETNFVECWSELTKLIYEFEGSYGSRLHKVNDNLFIAYAQWPDQNTYDKAGGNLPESALKLRQQMRECCSEIKTDYELPQTIKDLLKNEQHKNFR